MGYGRLWPMAGIGKKMAKEIQKNRKKSGKIWGSRICITIELQSIIELRITGITFEKISYFSTFHTFNFVQGRFLH